MANIKAVFFDQDGVIIDTERDGHRVAFNQTFRHFNLDLEWDVKTYHALLQVGGGKERMKKSFKESRLSDDFSQDELDALIKKTHQHKTDLFIEMLGQGQLPLRPGVQRVMKQINKAGLILGVTTTSSQKTAEAITANILKDIRFDFILAGDMVSQKKPHPEIYLKAIQKAGVKPEEGLVIEDSRIGVCAAKAAGLKVAATVNPYTKDEDLSDADLVLSCLGDRECPARVIRGKGFDAGVVDLDDIMRYFA